MTLSDVCVHCDQSDFLPVIVQAICLYTTSVCIYTYISNSLIYRSLWRSTEINKLIELLHFWSWLQNRLQLTLSLLWYMFTWQLQFVSNLSQILVVMFSTAKGKTSLCMQMFNALLYSTEIDPETMELGID